MNALDLYRAHALTHPDVLKTMTEQEREDLTHDERLQRFDELWKRPKKKLNTKRIPF